MTCIKYHFCGIGGSGMSPLAQVLLGQGHQISGSDRAYDNGQSMAKFQTLEKLGCTLFPQDGSGIQNADILVISSAVEESIPDVKAALEKGIKIQKRSEVLAEIFNSAPFGIAVGGTSGKSTTTAMIGHILKTCGKQPDVINGAVMKNALESEASGLGNAYIGDGNLCVIEADESDGSIAGYHPAISLVNNISEDHKSMDELRTLFGDFVNRASLGAVLNMDCDETIALQNKHKRVVTFSLKNPEADFYAEDIQTLTAGISFKVQGKSVELQMPGHHNIANALAAIAACMLAGCELKETLEALKSFKGVKRRLDVLGEKSGIFVIDDFAHNPDKIAATLHTLQQYDGRVLLMYQPHGFAPTKMMKNDLIQVFTNGLKDQDILCMPEIYFAGGTVEKSISSQDVIGPIQAQGKNALFFEDREQVAEYLKDKAEKGDRIVIMGARDDTLTDLGFDILNSF